MLGAKRCPAHFAFSAISAVHRLLLSNARTPAQDLFWRTPFAGLGFSGDLDSGTGALGVVAGYVWTERVSLEAELNVLPSSEANGLIEVGTHSWTLTANALYHFSGRTWAPYGVFGIGFATAART